MIVWLCSAIALGKRHGYSVEFPTGAQEIPKNSPDGYVALCGTVLPALGDGSLNGVEEIEAFYAIPKCEKCATLTPIGTMTE